VQARTVARRRTAPVAARNAEIADVFDETADLLEIQGENPFRIRAYRNAARLLRGLKEEAADIRDAGRDLSGLPGIGEDLAGKIGEVIDTGGTEILRRLHRQLPHSIVELLRIPGLGPKRAKLLHDRLGIKSLAQLRKAAEAGKLRSLSGVGARTEAKILQATAAQQQAAPRLTLAAAAPQAQALIAYLRSAPGIKQVAIAGSYRRARETVGDLDILATSSQPESVIEYFISYGAVDHVVASGTTRATIVLRGGLQVDLRVVEDASYGAALHYFTGSKAHNIAVRRLGQQAGLKINEYGVFRGEKRVAGDTEKSVFRAVGLPFIPAELREDRGEIDAARSGQLPELIEYDDLCGDLHCHTKATDGHNTLEEMAAAAREHGLKYLAVTEHSQRLTVARGFDPRRLGRQIDEIDRLNERLTGITLLKGIEVDILEDGSLDLPDNILSRLDLVVGAVHSHFNLPADKQTSRILRAMENTHFSILAHPTGRLLGTREAAPFQMETVIEAACDRGCFLELNAQPDRMDLSDVYCQAAKAAGVLISIGSDSHGTTEFDFLRFGIGQARRGWLEKKDVLNTRPLRELRALLARTM
jgi:DNA polymerase (family 10)